MMTRVMTVEVVGQAFGLPLDSVVETTIVDRNMIVPIGSGRAFMLRDRTIPLLDLADTLASPRGDWGTSCKGRSCVDKWTDRRNRSRPPRGAPGRYAQAHGGSPGQYEGRRRNHASWRWARFGRAGRTGDV